MLQPISVSGVAVVHSELKAARELPREIWALVLTGFTIAIGYGFVAPAIPIYASTFGVSVLATTSLISIFAVARLVFGPFAGTVHERVGPYWTCILGLGTVSIGTAACAFVTEFWHLMLMRVIEGAGSALFFVSGGALLAGLSPPHRRAFVSGLYSSFFMTGVAMGPLVGSALLTMDLRLPFLVYATALAAAAVLVAFFLPHYKTIGAEFQSGEQTAGSKVLKFRTVIRVRSYQAALVSNFTSGWILSGVRVSLIPLYVLAVLKVDIAWSGIVIAATAIGGILVTPIAGLWSDKRGRQAPVVIGSMILGIMCFVMGITDNIWIFAICALIMGIATGLLTPAVNASVADVINRRGGAGPVMAGFQMSGDMGMIVGPIIAGTIAMTVSYKLAMMATGLLAVISALVWLTVVSKKD